MQTVYNAILNLNENQLKKIQEDDPRDISVLNLE